MRFSYILILILLLSGCAGDIESEKTVIWDVSHKPVFGIEYYREFITILGAHGLGVKANKDKLTEINGRCLVIAGATEEFSEEEINAISRYVEDGGKVMILLHIPPKMNLNPLLTNLGFNVSDTILIQQNQNTTIISDSFEKNILTDGLERLMLFGCFYTDNAIAKCECFADVNKDRIADEEERGEFGVIGYRKIGDGEVLVITDDAIIADSLIVHADNRKFAENIARWIQLG
jgi:hypothetical protein